MWEREYDVKPLGQFVRQRRKALGLTQEELGDRLQWAQERVSTVENGKYGLPSLPQLVRLASALEAPIAELLGTLGYVDSASELSGQLAPSSLMCGLVERITHLRDGVLDVEARVRKTERQLEDAASLCNAVRMQRQLMAELLNACRD